MNFIDKWKKARKLKRGNIEELLRRIDEESKECDPDSEQFKRLRQAYEQELKNKKLVKEMKLMGLQFDKILLIAVILLIAGFGFALDMESPKALKIAQFVLSIVKKV